MKNIFISAFFIVSSATAYAGEVLHCTGGGGGPQPASAVLKIYQNTDGSLLIHATLTNPNYPNGISGELAAQVDTNSEVTAQGDLGRISLVFQLNVISSDSVNLSINSDGNHTIEFGYGAHFDCTP